MSDWNDRIIEEFRANDGIVGGPFTGGNLLLLHTVGARSGQPRVNPLVYATDGTRLVIAASKAGAPTNPDWFHNVAAHPDVEVEVGSHQGGQGRATQVQAARATIYREGAERDRLYGLMVAAMPGFGDYERATDRIIPVITLDVL